MSEAKSRKPITDSIQVVLEEGKRVRERIGKILVDQMQGDEFSVDNLVATARHAMKSVYESGAKTLDSAMPDGEDSALREVVYGVGDAFGRAAKATGATLDKARQEGKEFAADDIKKITVDLRRMSSEFVDTVIEATNSASEHGTALVQSVTRHANQAAQDMKPQIENALSAAAQHPVQLTKDAAKTGVDVTREIAGSLFSVLGKMMQKAADALQVDDKPAGSDAAAPEGDQEPKDREPEGK